MFALPIAMSRFKTNIFYQNSPKIQLFLQTDAKFSIAGGSALRPPCLRRLGALPPDPQSSYLSANFWHKRLFCVDADNYAGES